MGSSLRLPAILAALAAGACASTGSDRPVSGIPSPAPVEAPVAVDVPATVPADGELAVADLDAIDPETVGEGEGESEVDDEAEAVADAELSPEDFEEGFCVDDIYAKYLTQRFAKEHHNDKTPKFTESRRHRRRAVVSDAQRKEFFALSYARDVMNGKTSPYFGAIPIIVNDKVDFWVQYYKTAGRKQFMRWLVRGEAIKKMVQPILHEGGIPMEFFYLAMIESGFSNSASSRVRATGTWQFMRGTAQLYGLKINHWVDERRDPVKSTIAAANYLKDLYADLGDWHLAMAAYNAGPGKIRKAMRLGGTKDFWKLADTRNLAKETKNYVPKVLAAILLSTDAKANGFDCQGVENSDDTLPDTAVIVKRPVKLDELAHELGLPLKTLIQWNPELIHSITPPSKSGYSLRLASAYANMFPSIEQKLSLIEVTDIQMHTVRRGDTLSRIAKQYKVAIKQILAINPELNASRLKPGRSIAIPIPGVITSVKRAEENHSVL